MAEYDRVAKASLDKIGFHLREEMITDRHTVKTKVDLLLDLVKKRKRTVPELCAILDADKRMINDWIEALEERKLLKMETSVFGKWFVTANGHKEQ